MVLKGQCQNLPDHTIEILSLKPAAQGIYSLGLSVLSKVPAKVKIFPPSQPACFYVSQRAESLHSAPKKRHIKGPRATVEGDTEQDGEVIASCLCGRSKGLFFF